MPIDTAIPADYHPDLIPDRPHLATARRALSSIYDTWSRINTAARSVSDKPRLAAEVEPLVLRTLGGVERFSKTIEKQREDLAKRIEASIRPERPDAAAHEIRAHFKASSERFSLLGEAIRTGDRRTVSAVFDAPAYLSGLSEKEAQTLRDVAKRTFAKVDSEALADVDKALARVERAAERFTETNVERLAKWRPPKDQEALKALKGEK